MCNWLHCALEISLRAGHEARKGQHLEAACLSETQAVPCPGSCTDELNDIDTEKALRLTCVAVLITVIVEVANEQLSICPLRFSPALFPAQVTMQGLRGEGGGEGVRDSLAQFG